METLRGQQGRGNGEGGNGEGKTGRVGKRKEVGMGR